MSSALALYQRFRRQIHEAGKFGIVGLTGIVVTNIVFAPLHNEFGLGVITAVTIATVAATIVTFLGNRYWAFRHREGAGTGKEGVTFFLLNGVGMLIQYAVLGFNTHLLGLTGKVETQIVLNIGIGLGTLFRFWSYRKFVWVSAEERLARLRRGRHRKGRATPDLAGADRPLGRDAGVPVAAPVPAYDMDLAYVAAPAYGSDRAPAGGQAIGPFEDGHVRWAGAPVRATGPGRVPAPNRAPGARAAGGRRDGPPGPFPGGQRADQYPRPAYGRPPDFPPPDLGFRPGSSGRRPEQAD